MKLITELPPFGQPVQCWVTGAELARMLKKADATGRAVIDYDLCTGRVALIGMTAKQAQPITKVSRGYRCTMAGLDPLERAHLRYSGGTISAYHNKKPSDRAIARFIKRAGPDRVFAELDRMTSPAVEAVVNEVIKTVIAAE
jgi:hypothetical protein